MLSLDLLFFFQSASTLIEQSINSVNVLGVDFSVVDYESASDILIEAAQQRKSFALFALPVHGIIETRRDHGMRQAVEKADMIVPDGQPVRWFMNHFHRTGLTDRVYGPELTLHVLEKANRLGLNVFLYGGAKTTTLTAFTRFVEANYPNVRICGTHREVNASDDTLTADQVNEAETHILLLGRGCPTQEKWIANHRGRVHAVMMGVGAAFSFHAGELEQAPSMMQGMGLEWLFRLYREPRRLWKRYFVTNVTFLVLVARRKLLGP